VGGDETLELAVMVDTFRPLKVTQQAVEIENDDYFRSWLYE
jgi:homogentisate 1,2-dioxygenase